MKVYDHIFVLVLILGFISFYVQTASNEELNGEKLSSCTSSGDTPVDENVPCFDRSKVDPLERNTASVNAQKYTSHAAKTDGPMVQTRYGTVKGLIVDKVYIFYGIPYADPPVRTRRWKPPTAVTSWTGVYDATFPRAACMQGQSDLVSDLYPAKISEDCLYLNIFVPLDVNFLIPMSKPLPVMVWIHGGAFIAGSASKPMYDGRFISNFTHTVVVSVGYRLGAFGFLVSGKDPKSAAVGNYGILDQQAALLWIQQNIAMFGGNPNKVTLFGESAGAQSVGLHLTMQSSQFLFQQAVLQSLPFSIPLKTRHQALRLGKEFAKAANCSVNDIVCLLFLSPQAVLEAQIKAGKETKNTFQFLEKFEMWGPIIDGALLKEQMLTAFKKGNWQKEKPVLLGSTSEESVLFIYAYFKTPMSLMNCAVYTTNIFKQHSLSILHKYMPLYKHADRRSMLSKIITDYMFLCPSRKLARKNAQKGSAMWMYVFDHVANDPRIWNYVTHCFKHVCHGAELPILFDSGSVANFTLSPAEELLADNMICYWGTFAHEGDPNSRGKQSSFCRQQNPPPWPEYMATSGWLVMNFTINVHADVSPRDRLCDFWDKLAVY